MSPSSATSSNSPPITGAASRLIRSTRPPWPLIPLKLDICVPPNSTCVEFYRLNFGAQELVASAGVGATTTIFHSGSDLLSLKRLAALICPKLAHLRARPQRPRDVSYRIAERSRLR